MDRRSPRPLDLQSLHDFIGRFMGRVSAAPRRQKRRSECEIGDWVAADAVRDWPVKSQRQHFRPDGSDEQWTFVRGVRREAEGEMQVWVRF